MKHIACILLVLILAGCNLSSKKTEGADSTKTVTDSAVVTQPPVAYSNPADINGSQAGTAFPGWELQNFSADKRESDVNDALGSLMSRYDERQYFRTIVSYSDSSWEEAGDNEDYNVNETILETVYLDSAFKVYAYSLEYHYTGNGNHTTTDIYLIKDDNIIAGFSDDNEDGQIGARAQVKFVTALCSECGTSTSLVDGMDSWKVDVVASEYIELLNTVINHRITRIANEINTNWETKINASPGFIISGSHPHDAGMPGRLGIINKTKLYTDQVGYEGFVLKRADQ